MNDNEAILKEIIFYLSACLDLSIKAANCSGKDIPQDEKNLKVLHDILSTLHHLEKIDSDKKTQWSENKN